MRGAIPPLRTDLEVQEGDELVELRDGQLLQVVTLAPRDYKLARHFDGRRSASEIEADLRAAGERIGRGRVRKVATDLDALHLLARPGVKELKPDRSAEPPPSLLGHFRDKPGAFVAQPEARWACRACGHCCHHLVVEVSEREEARIDASLYEDVLQGAPFAESSFISPKRGAKRVLRQRENGACVFLQGGLCLVHARQGLESKPDACQMFPFSFTRVPSGEIRVGLRMSCRSAADSLHDGPEISSFAPFTERIAKDTGAIFVAPRKLLVFHKEQSFAEYEKFTADIVERLKVGRLAPSVFAELDHVHFGGRLAGARARYGLRLLAYVDREKEDGATVGSFAWLLSRLPRGRLALRRLRDGNLPPDRLAPETVETLIELFRRAVWVSAPLNAPDAGLGVLGLVLALEASTHATGSLGTPTHAVSAFDVYTAPLLETTEHLWPILDALDPEYAAALRKE